MGTQLDIYVLSMLRDKRAINTFIETYANRAASENREDEELMLLSLNSNGNLSAADAFEWVPAKTLTHALRIGLSRPPRAFAIYLTPKHPQIQEVTLCFTTDNQIIFGLSIDDQGAEQVGRNRANEVLKQLMGQFRAKAGMVVVEDSPPYSEDDFMAMISSGAAVGAMMSDKVVPPKPKAAQAVAAPPKPAPKRTGWFRLGRARKS